MENKPFLKKVRRPINRAQPFGAYQMPSSPPAEPSYAPASSADENVVQPSQSTPQDEPAPVTNQAVASYEGANLPANRRAEPTYASGDNHRPFTPQYVNDDNFDDTDYDYDLRDEHSVGIKTFVFCLIGFLVIGLLMGKFLLGAPTTTHSGLQGVVLNSNVPRGRARCGVADRGQGCVLYMMNPQRRNVKVKDFYDLAAQMTGRQRYELETVNFNYAQTEIPPGEIAQLNIPPSN
ncbi:MAG: hypothetical protein IJ184_05835 [Alphaproteobacteria bacterium]|nr:hypothetical protein [Alphaproteobacteria bacterium]